MTDSHAELADLLQCAEFGCGNHFGNPAKLACCKTLGSCRLDLFWPYEPPPLVYLEITSYALTDLLRNERCRKRAVAEAAQPLNTMSAECARLAVDLERLLPKVDAEGLDEDRRIAFAEAALSKIAALEAAADGDATVLAQVATYEEAMLAVIDGLRPPEEEEAEPPAPAEDLGLRRRAVPVQRDESDPESEDEPPQNEADSLQKELETMTARLKASSLAVHEKLREQSKKMEQLDNATSQNQNAVSKERAALDVRAAARTRTLLQALAALVAVVVSFLGTYVFIAVFPKHR